MELGNRGLSHRHVEVFRTVMACGSVTEAAARLHSSQPTLSRDLARLEQLLGFALFERLRGRLKPTERALALYDEVQRSFVGLERIVERAQALSRGTGVALECLALPALNQALLPGATARLLAAQPQARVKLTPAEPPLLDEWLSAQRYDLGLTEQASAPPGTRQELLFDADEVCVLPAGHALLAEPVLRPEHFDQQAFISLAAQDPYRLAIDACFARAGVARQMSLEAHSAASIAELVRHGLGLSILNPLTALNQFEGLAGLQLRRFEPSIPYRIYLAIPEFRPVHGLQGALRQALRDEAQALKDRLAALLAL